MVTYTSIIKAINEKIKTSFPTIHLDASDIAEKILRPSFRTSIDAISTSNFMNVSQDRQITIRIYYFPTDKNKYRIEMLDVQDKLEQAFIDDNIITTDEGFIIEIFESSFDLIDGVLHFYFDIQLSEDYNRINDTENMEDITINNN